MMSITHPAFRRRIEAVRPRLFRTAFAWCHNRDLAEDLAQETLAKALTKAGQLRSDDALEGWLFRIMANLWRDHVRRDRPMDSMEDVDVRTEETPEDLNSRQQSVMRIRRALGKLQENYRIVLTLVDIEGFSYAEAAAIMEVPAGTVMSRLSRARKQLTELLRDSADSSSGAARRPRVKQLK